MRTVFSFNSRASIVFVSQHVDVRFLKLGMPDYFLGICIIFHTMYSLFTQKKIRPIYFWNHTCRRSNKSLSNKTVTWAKLFMYWASLITPAFVLAPGSDHTLLCYLSIFQGPIRENVINGLDLSLVGSSYLQRCRLRVRSPPRSNIRAMMTIDCSRPGCY